PFHGLLEYTNRAGQVQSQPVAQPDGGGHHEDALRLEKPGADMDARHDEEEREAAVIGRAGDGGIAAPEHLVEHAAPRAQDQVGPVFVGEQVAAVFVGEDAAGVIDAMQRIEEALQCRAPADLVGAGGFFQLEAHQPRHRRMLVAIVLVHVQGGDEGRSDHRDGQGEPEPEQDLGEERVHSAAASSGVRQNWYPTPRMVLIRSSPPSSFLRRWLMCMSMERSKGVALRLYKIYLSEARGRRGPAGRSSSSRVSNS